MMQPDPAHVRLAEIDKVKDWPAWTKMRLTKAFAALRKQHYMTRQAFSCCSGCAGGDIAAHVEAMPALKQERLAGAVYYHRQDADALKSSKVGKLHIRYGQVHAGGKVYGKPEIEIGNDVAQALRDQGLCVEWDGSPDHTIVVHGLADTVLDAARATVRLGGHYEDVLKDSAQAAR